MSADRPRQPLPRGFALAVDAGVRRAEGGRVLIGGSPLRVVRLTDAGARLVQRWDAGESVATDQEGHRSLARRLLDGGLAHPRWAAVPAPYDPADVAVVIPIRGEPSGLARTLAAVAADGPGAIVVVDDGSTAEHASAIAAVVAEAPGTTLRRSVANEGPGAARQRGAAAVGHPVLAFVDSDVVPRPGWLGLLLAHLADPEVAAAAPRIVADPPPTLPSAVAAYERVRSSLDRGPVEGPVRPRSRVPYVPTAALVVRREALEAVGGFDPDLRFGEDVDLVWRMAAAGWTIRYEPTATAAHPGRPTVRAWLRQRFAYGSSAAPLAVRHGGAVAPLAVSGWSGAAWGLVAGGAPVAGVVVMAGTTLALAPKLKSLDHPATEAVRLAGTGHLFAGRQVASALRRAWFPALAAMSSCRRTRPAAIAALVVAPLLDHREAGAGRPGPISWLAISLADDLAYASGLWAGLLRRRRLSRAWWAVLPSSSGRFPPPEP